MRTAATLAALLFLILLASLTSVQTPTPVEANSSAATSSILNSASLTGTVTVSHSSSVVYDIFLHNTGNTDLISFTVKITNTMPIGQISMENYAGFENDSECATRQDMCSSAFVESLGAGESITLTIEHQTSVPSTCSYDNNLPPFIQDLRDTDEVVENSIRETGQYDPRYVRWTSIRSVKAVAFFDEDTIMDLQVPEPLTYHNGTCFFRYIEQPSTPTPAPSPTREPSTLLLPQPS